jgi:hypothetical protein
VTKITRRAGVEPAPSPERRETEKPAAKEPAQPEKAGWQPPSRTHTGDASDAADALVSGATIINPPSVLTAPTPGSTAPAVSSSAHGVSVSAHGASAEVSRATLTVSGTRTGNGTEDSVSASLARNSFSVVAGGTRGTRSASGNVAFTSGALSAGFDLARGGTKVTQAFGFVGTVSGDRKVADLGPTEGGRRVKLETSRGVGVWASLGLASPALSAGTTFSRDRSKEVSYTTTLPTEAARAELHAGNAIERFVDARAKAFGLKADALAPPPMDEPEKLAVGDELTVAVRGSMSGGLALGAMGARAGAQASLRGDFELSLKKLSPTQVELVLTPTRVRGLQLFLDTPSPLEVDVTRVQARSLSQGFVFDLTQPGAKAAYLEALQGKLPAALGGLKAAAPADAKELVKLAKAVPLPSGVQRTFLEGVETTATGAGGGLDFGVLERLSGIAGLSTRTTRVSEDRARTDGAHTVVEASRGVEKRREVLLSGTETTQVFGSVRTRVTFDDALKPTSHFDGLGLSATLTDDKVRGDELDEEMVKRLNETFGLSLARSERPGRGLSRTVKVELNLSAEVLDSLAEATPDSRKGQALVATLQHLDATARAEQVRDFVAQGGLEAMGQVFRWAELAPDALSFTSEAGAYEKTGESARALALKYNAAIALTDGTGTITHRFEEVTKALDKTAEAKLDALADPFLTEDARSTVTATLGGDSTTLTTLISFDHLSKKDRAALKDELSSGWVTGAERRLIDHLEAGAVA